MTISHRTLAIETSCDDTSLAIVFFDGKKFMVEKMLAYSQINEHQQFGGVMPEIAYRLHAEKIGSLIVQMDPDRSLIDSISVTTEPGLPGSLLIGKTAAAVLSHLHNKPLIEVNHIDGHLFSILCDRSCDDILFPALCLTASGGHNDLYFITQPDPQSNFFLFAKQKIGSTTDDASGEAFDKVSRMLGGPYPGGARISQQAKRVTQSRYQFKKTETHQKYDFSFSGMKSQVQQLLSKHFLGKLPDDHHIAEICRSFEQTIARIFEDKIIAAVQEFEPASFWFVGGVSANTTIVNHLTQAIQQFSVPLMRPVHPQFSTDNAGMIGVAGIIDYVNKQ